jgi:hypothetical protein
MHHASLRLLWRWTFVSPETLPRTLPGLVRRRCNCWVREIDDYRRMRLKDLLNLSVWTAAARGRSNIQGALFLDRKQRARIAPAELARPSFLKGWSWSNAKKASNALLSLITGLMNRISRQVTPHSLQVQSGSRSTQPPLLANISPFVRHFGSR